MWRVRVNIGLLHTIFFYRLEKPELDKSSFCKSILVTAI